jgi:hypothetical protein
MNNSCQNNSRPHVHSKRQKRMQQLILLLRACLAQR